MGTCDVSLREATRVLGVPVETLREWIRRGRLQARRAGQVYFLDRAELERLRAHRARLAEWPRLVDVARRLGIHRNQGAALCQAEGLPVEKDFHDDCRISPAAVAFLERRVALEAERRDWVRLNDLARELGLPDNVVSGGVRNHKVEYGHDIVGRVILPPATVRWVREWRQSLHQQRAAAAVIGERRLLSLRATAGRAAEKFATAGSAEHARIAEKMRLRYRHAVRQGLPVFRMHREPFLEEQTAAQLIDAVTAAEACRLTGASRSRLRWWEHRGVLRQVSIPGMGKLLSYSALLDLLASQPMVGGNNSGVDVMPVAMLPPWHEMERRLTPAGSSLGTLLALGGGAADTEIDALQRGSGVISARLAAAVREWLRAVGRGSLPPKPLINDPAHREALGRAPELPSLLAWFCGLPSEHLAGVFRLGLRRRVNDRELDAFCGHLASGQPVRVYDPANAFGPQDFLVDPTAEDLGPVRRVERSVVEVAWMRRGPLQMRHGPAGGRN